MPAPKGRINPEKGRNEGRKGGKKKNPEVQGPGSEVSTLVLVLVHSSSGEQPVLVQLLSAWILVCCRAESSIVMTGGRERGWLEDT